MRGPSFEQTWIPFIQGCIALSLVEIGPVFLEKKDFSNLSLYFRYFVLNSPLEKAGAPHLNKIEFPSPKDAICNEPSAQVS